MLSISSKGSSDQECWEAMPSLVPFPKLETLEIAQESIYQKSTEATQADVIFISKENHRFHWITGTLARGNGKQYLLLHFTK